MKLNDIIIDCKMFYVIIERKKLCFFMIRKKFFVCIERVEMKKKNIYYLIENS
jgi:hypothetical protein